ncbi:MAG: hypothetical protein GY861_20265 [bacterium]|nr:hypothetical protein [bacterium]
MDDMFNIRATAFPEMMKFTSKQWAERKTILQNANAISDINGLQFVSIQKYIQHIRLLLDQAGKKAKTSRSLDDITNYELETCKYLQDSVFILATLCENCSGHSFGDDTDGVVESLEELIEDTRYIFEHEIAANKLFIEVGLKT